MTHVVVTWLVAGGMFCGIGLLVRQALLPPTAGRQSAFDAFWIGLATAVGLLQVWHIWRPVTTGTVAALGVVAVIGLVRAVVSSGRSGPRVRMGAAVWVFVAAAAVSTVWLANQALGRIVLYDTGLYHATAVRWITDSAIVPGLTNLHYRLGFNNSGFLYAALFEAAGWHGRASHVVNGLLVLVLLLELLWLMIAAGATRSLAARNTLPWLLLAPAIYAVFSEDFISFSTDLPSTVVAFVVFGRLARLAASEAPLGVEQRSGALTIAALLPLAVCFKTSLLIAVAGAWLVAGALVWFARRTAPDAARVTLVIFAAFAVLLLGPWMVRGVILSGYPLYPDTHFGFPVPWRASTQVAALLRDIITAWPRGPELGLLELREFTPVHVSPDDLTFLQAPSRLVHGWSWLGPWVDHVVETGRRQILAPLALAFCACMLWLWRWWSTGTWRSTRTDYRVLLALPLLAGVWFWLLSAPSPRFGAFLFWLLAAVLFEAALPATFGIKRWHGVVYGTLCVALAVGPELVGPSSANPNTPWWFDAGADHDVGAMPLSQLTPFTTRCGLIVHVPVAGDQVWDGPLPNTPYPSPNLRLRRAGELGSGFVVDPTCAGQEKAP